MRHHHDIHEYLHDIHNQHYNVLYYNEHEHQHLNYFDNNYELNNKYIYHD